jgi:hypothetical protein
MVRPIFNLSAVKILFTTAQLKEMKEEAIAIQRKKEENKDLITNHKISGLSDTETFIVGFLGEYSWERIFHQRPDTRPKIGGDKWKDFCFHGTMVEIKTSKHFLVFNNMEHFSAEVAVLIDYDPSDYSLVWLQGWITKQEFREKHFVNNFGYGNKLCVQPNILHPITTLEEYCLKKESNEIHLCYNPS